ncbi:hypothetical protein RvY_07634 [Ramazzottius varieornatus]|uniref:snRNA-activating protein complex subunit 1 n=1 Tax=Ramazzottius varieornatus TaxID=947166 RepID=A0A1D1V2W5_RAMVA|nr:hypothetical protein RvY_07634 [Ramazzottius varieornatus]
MDRPRTRKRTNKEREEEEYALTGALNGFREDVRRMLDAYLQTQSSRLVDFVDLWERVKFGHVFAGFRTKNNTKRLDFTELHQFAEKVFHEAVLLCLTPNNQQVRQAGFYFLYCLYIARPLHCHAKIRVHPKNELVPLKTFAKSLQTEGSPDPLMCFLELYRTHAFDYTLTSFPMGWHTQRSRMWRDGATLSVSTPGVLLLPVDPSFTAMAKAEADYTQKKADLFSSSSNEINILDHAKFDSTSKGFPQCITLEVQRCQEETEKLS